MKAAEVERFARATLREHGLHGWRFRWNTTSKRYAGWCKKTERVVEVSEWVIDLGWPEEALRDIVLHEVAHALAPEVSSHGPAWKAIAARIGADPTAYYDDDLPTPKDTEWTWRQHCPDCGWERYLLRLPRAGSSCPDCGNGAFNPALLLYIDSRDGRPVTARGVRATHTRYDALDRLPPGTEGL